jgi:vitamin B12 transporter
MLGKAVKIRHCPATVSAPRLGPVMLGYWNRQEFSLVFSAPREVPEKPLEMSCKASFLGRWLEKVQVRRPVLGVFTRLRSEGNEGAIMPVSVYARARLSRVLPSIIIVLLFAAHAAVCIAASVRGVVTDPAGAKVTDANVSLVSNGKVVATAVSTADGSFQILTGTAGRFFLVVSAKSFRQVSTPGFYGGALDNIERNVVLEPEWVRESIVVTATGTATPQAQTSSATSVLGPGDLALQSDLVSELRMMPGTFVVQSGQMGSVASLFVRGGDSTSNKVLVDGVSAGDLGGGFDFGPLSTTAVESAEIYRGPNSSLYGADAASGVVSLTTPHGTTSFPSLLFHGDFGRFDTSREELELAGAHNKLDYLGAFSWLQTGNDLPHDEYHVATTAGNLGWQPTGSTQIRATLHYGVAGTGVPNAWDFYHIADQATEKDQDLFFSGSVDNQTTVDFHQNARYGMTRKREQYHLWQQSGSGTFDAYGDSFGDDVTITGANGYSATGQALLDYAGTYPQGNQIVSNRDQIMYQGDYRFTPHLIAMIGFHYEDERGAAPDSSYLKPVERTNYDYLAELHGDFKSRLFYTLGGSLERYSLFGTQTSPRGGISYYVMRPRKGIFSGTRVLLNFGDAVREPSLTDQFYSLYSFLEANGGQSTIAQLHISPLAAPATRTYEGGAEQAFFGQRLVFRASFFHNEFGRQIEYVGLDLIPELLPNLTPAQQNQLEQFLQANGAYEQSLNTEAYRALGVESTVEGGIGRAIFLRGGYTYLDAVVQRSFTNDDVALLGPIPTYNGIPVGVNSPLQGARPFRRAPHTGFLTATYSTRKLTGLFTAAFASRSDDSDFLGGDDLNGGNSLLLPNRNLDYGYAKLDLGGSYQLLSWLGIYAQGENLMNSQHIAPIGFPSLPLTAKAGLKIEWGPGSKH